MRFLVSAFSSPVTSPPFTLWMLCPSPARNLSSSAVLPGLKPSDAGALRRRWRRSGLAGDLHGQQTQVVGGAEKSHAADRREPGANEPVDLDCREERPAQPRPARPGLAQPTVNADPADLAASLTAHPVPLNLHLTWRPEAGLAATRVREPQETPVIGSWAARRGWDAPPVRSRSSRTVRPLRAARETRNSRASQPACPDGREQRIETGLWRFRIQ